MLFINTWKVGTELTAFAWTAQETTEEFTARISHQSGLAVTSFSSRLLVQLDGVMEMTDKELIELAANAAGLHVKVASNSGRGLKVHGNCNWWNPLTDDGDALRLAVKLHMQVSITTESCRAETMPVLGVRVNDKDEMAATRRAIVRAAAAIGGAVH